MRQTLMIVICGLLLAHPAMAQQSAFDQYRAMQDYSAQLNRADQDRFDRRNAEHLRSIETERQHREVVNELRGLRSEIETIQRRQENDRIDRELGLR